jgi:ribosomal protein S18 acetylase RimI-like enzyme
LFLLGDEEKKNSEKSFNLNLLAVDKIYQSKGIGSYFLSESIKNINKNYFKFNQIICEAPPTEALKFYKKNNFFLIGKKIRFFKNFYILLKKF